MKRVLSYIDARGLGVLLLMLLVADAAFIGLHIAVSVTGSKAYLFKVYEEGGYPELYQYVKWLWLITALTYYVVKERKALFLPWVLVFGYFLIDDSLSAHEAFGRYVEANHSFAAPFGLAAFDVAELFFSAAVGAVLLLALAWAYLRGTWAFKKTSRDLLVLVAALAMFGVAVDILAGMAGSGGLKTVFMSIEDSGEMLVASVMVWYVVTLVVGAPPAAAGAEADPSAEAPLLVEAG